MERHQHLQGALYQRQLQRVALSRAGTPRARRGLTPGRVHTRGVVAFPPRPSPADSQVRGWARFTRPSLPKAGSGHGRGSLDGGKGPFPPSSWLSALGPPRPAWRAARGGYSRSRLSRQSAVQPRGIPRSARAPRRPSILPARLPRDAQSPRRCSLARTPAPPPGSGVGDSCFSLPLPLESWQGRPLSLAATNVSFPAQSQRRRTLGGRLGLPPSRPKKVEVCAGPRCLVQVYVEAPSSSSLPLNF